MSKKQIHESWVPYLAEEFQKPYMKELKKFLVEELNQKKTIYPHGKNIFAAFNETPFDQVKVVVIGQDPYHGPNQAHGLSFSVNQGVRFPPSLLNIFKELENDLGMGMPSHGNLLSWARQGVLMLNAVLTVEHGKAGSHHGKGWEIFTDKVVQVLNEHKKGLIFVLWGSPAQKKGSIVDPKKHFILKAPHPSPLSAHRGFLGCRHFSTINKILKQNQQADINWQIV